MEAEEGLHEAEAGEYFEIDGQELTPEEREVLTEIRKKKSMLIQQHRMKKSTAESCPTVPRKFDKDRKYTSQRMGRKLSEIGIDPTNAINCSGIVRGRKRERSLGGDSEAMDIEGEQFNKKLRTRSRSRSRQPGEITPGEGFKDSAQKIKAIIIGRKFRMKGNKAACKVEGDRVIPKLKPKHLFSGKRSNGKTTRR